METWYLCGVCDWTGPERDCNKGYRATWYSDGDVEPYLICPQCKSEELVELPNREVEPEPIPA